MYLTLQDPGERQCVCVYTQALWGGCCDRCFAADIQARVQVSGALRSLQQTCRSEARKQPQQPHTFTKRKVYLSAGLPLSSKGRGLPNKQMSNRCSKDY